MADQGRRNRAGAGIAPAALTACQATVGQARHSYADGSEADQR
jgi:hypothetical protein